MSSLTNCIDCERSPEASMLEGLFTTKQKNLDNYSHSRYAENQPMAMNDVKEYNTYIEVYEQYKDKIYSYFYYRTAHNSHLAEDLASDTFVKAYEKFYTYNDTYAISTWLYSIARNTLIDHMRKEGKRTQFELDENHEDSDALNFLETIDQEIDIERVQSVMSELSDTQERMLRMKFFEYKDTKEIAEIESMQESAVRKNISRGIQKLQGLLAILILFIISI